MKEGTIKEAWDDLEHTEHILEVCNSKDNILLVLLDLNKRLQKLEKRDGN